MTRGLQTVFAGAIALGLAHPLLPQMQKLPQMHTGGGTIIVPESSIARPEDVGKRARTFVRIFIPDGGLPINAANTPGGFFETPASLACVYQLVTAAKTCNPSTATTVSHGGAHAIALVDAYDDPNAASDLAVFSTEFGLPASGDLLPAVTLASNLVSAAGGGEVSMSWGFGDFAGENGFDGYFTTTGVVYFSSSGDSAGISYPCTSPDVVCVGGTTISRNATTGNFEYESAWPDTGGGPSPNEPIPSYQSGIASIVGTQRGTPDLAFVADGRTPVWIYDMFPISGTSGTWWLASGTSVSAPGMAGIVNTAGHFYTSTNAELSEVYRREAGDIEGSIGLRGLALVEGADVRIAGFLRGKNTQRAARVRIGRKGAGDLATHVVNQRLAKARVQSGELLAHRGIDALRRG